MIQNHRLSRIVGGFKKSAGRELSFEALPQSIQTVSSLISKSGGTFRSAWLFGSSEYVLDFGGRGKIPKALLAQLLRLPGFRYISIDSPSAASLGWGPWESPGGQMQSRMYKPDLMEWIAQTRDPAIRYDSLALGL